MTRYKFILKLKEDNILEKTIKSGMLISRIPYMIHAYETYLKVKQKEKMVRYSETAELIGRKSRYVMDVVSYMESSI